MNKAIFKRWLWLLLKERNFRDFVDFVEQSQVMIFEKNLDHSFEKVYSQKKIKFQLAKFNS